MVTCTTSRRRASTKRRGNIETETDIETGLKGQLKVSTYLAIATGDLGTATFALNEITAVGTLLDVVLAEYSPAINKGN